MGYIILAVVLVAIFLFVIVAALQPGEMRVVRSTAIAASPADVFPQVNDLYKWKAWSPWAKLDPAAKETFEGPPAGPGAEFKWSGNKKIGEGAMKITDSRPNDLVRIALTFVRPFPCSNLVEFTFTPEGNQTAVAWTMTGQKNFAAKAVGLFMNMDKMVGRDFEKGLAAMKAVVEESTRR